MLQLKAALKNVSWVYDINAALKASTLKRKYAATVRYYAKKPLPPEGARELLWRRLGSRAQRIRELGRPLNIFFLGTDEQQDQSGILQALGKLGSVTYFTRADGSYGQNDPGPVAERQAKNTVQLKHLFHQLSEQGRCPDILIGQTWGTYIAPEILDYFREKFGTIVINIGMDDRHQYWGQKVGEGGGGTFALIPYIDLALTAAPECVEWYLKEGCPAIFMPEASDAEMFYPMPALPKIHDVSFVGGRYGIRKEIVLALRKAGIRVTAYGAEWEQGRIATEDVPKLFAQSKIVLGIGTVGHCHDFYALKMRDFDGPMSGSFYLTHDNPDLYGLYTVGKEIATYRSIEECVLKAKYYIEHDLEREQIASAGYRRAAKEHTWKERFGSTLELLLNS